MVGVLDVIRGKVGLAPRDIALPTEQEAAADLAKAKAALAAAREKVQVAVDLWPDGARDRRWIESSLAQPRLASVNPNELQQGHQDRSAAFRQAAEAERAAIAAVDLAEAIMTRVGREAASSGARGAIRSALEDLRMVGAETAKVQASIDRARAHLASMSDRRDRAVDAVEQARARRVETVTTSATSGGDIPQDRTLQKARAAMAEAEDELAAARDALAGIEPTLDEPERAERKARTRLETAVDLVVVGHLKAIQPGVLEAARQHYKRGVAVGYLASLIDPYESDHQTRVGAQNFAARHTIAADIDMAEAERLRAESIGPWQAYRLALLRDPDAKPPEAGL